MREEDGSGVDDRREEEKQEEVQEMREDSRVELDMLKTKRRKGEEEEMKNKSIMAATVINKRELKWKNITYRKPGV